jgi:hypothetical protein
MNSSYPVTSAAEIEADSVRYCDNGGQYINAISVSGCFLLIPEEMLLTQNQPT